MAPREEAAVYGEIDRKVTASKEETT